jgi:hypothetical protein
MRTLLVAALVIAGCSQSSPGGGSNDGGAGGDLAAASQYLLQVSPGQLTVRQHVGGSGEAPLELTFTAPVDLVGGGLPPDLINATFDGAVAEVELPQGGNTDENAMSSTGLVSFDAPKLCLVGAVGCANAGQDGYWTAHVIAADGSKREVQLAKSQKDSGTKKVYEMTFGVFLAAGDTIHAGERLVLDYLGKASGRATDWTGLPFVVHFRYRSFSGATAAPWTVLDDSQVEPLQLVPEAMPKYVRALAPLDVQAGVPFTVAVVVTDHYGNPKPITGSVMLSGGVTAELMFNDEWRKELQVTYATAGAYKIVPQLAGARGLYHYTQAWSGPPPVQRLLGDLHSHSGDGGAQRKFIGAFIAGDHRALYTRTHDQLRYEHEVAALDFGTVSEHAVRWDAYTPPAAVAADAQFQTGGACAGSGNPIPGLGDWFTTQQQIVQQYDAAAAGAFIAFPAFEWHGAHNLATDTSPLHRIVMFRDFAGATPLPIMPGDIENQPPQCIVRFLSLAGFGPKKALVIPHMMQADDKNIDWDLTYADTSVAPRTQTDSYYRVGEIYSARAVDQTRAYGIATLSVFERADTAGGRWAYRYGWRNLGAHIGVIADSDNHEQMAGVNDDIDLDGVNYHSNEPGGYAVVLAASRDRGGIYDALTARATYATSGIRAWLDYNVDGSPMGSQIARASGATATANIALMAGLDIATVELFSVQVGATTPTYTTVSTSMPNAETFKLAVPLTNPVAVGGGTQEWLYYVRAYLKAPSSTFDADEAVWSSPIWISWTN